MDEARRLTLLEERYSHLQKHVTAQDKAMLEMHEEIAKLRRELAAVRGQAQTGTDGGSLPDEERPPHY